MKKKLPIIIVGLLVILVAGFLVIKSQKKQNTSEITTTEVEVPQAPINERPFVSLIPRSDAHQLTLQVENLKNITTVEYELVYLVGDAQRGVIGSIVTNAKSAVSKDLLMGSCSKNVCKYDEGVTGGTLTLRFRGSGSVSKYEAPFSLQKMPEAKNKLTLGETGFSFTGKLNKAVYYLTMGTVGLPSDLGKEVVGGPYGIFSSDNGLLSGIVGLESSETLSSSIMGWNSKSSAWETIDSQKSTTGLNVFILVK